MTGWELTEAHLLLSAIVGAGGFKAIIWGKDKVKERKESNGNGSHTEARLAAGSEKFQAMERRIETVEHEVKEVRDALVEIKGMERRMDGVEHEVKEIRGVLSEVQKTMVRVETKMDVHMEKE